MTTMMIDSKASAKFLRITPLLLSVAVESYWCTRHLLEAGANVSINDVNGKGFLQYLKRTSWVNIFTKEELHSLKKLIEKLRPTHFWSNGRFKLLFENK